jgi:hypothetical protein
LQLRCDRDGGGGLCDGNANVEWRAILSVPRCGVDAAGRDPGFGASAAGDLGWGDCADVFRYAWVECGADRGFVGVWKNGSGDGDQRRLRREPGYGSSAAGIADVYGDGDFAGWKHDQFECVVVEQPLPDAESEFDGDGCELERDSGAA